LLAAHLPSHAVTLSKRTVEIELRFLAGDRVVEQPKGTFRGGVADPNVTTAFGFNVLRQELDAAGEINPSPGDPAYDGSLQINLWGDSASFREIGRYFLGLAELDTSADPDFHEHHELTSTDGRCQVHLIVRKPLT
jgi:hypothetical protein